MSEFEISQNHPLHLKTILAMDFGEKFIGTATFCVNRDPFPTPYGRIVNSSKEKIIHEISKIIDIEGIDILVVGLPYLIDGKKTSTTLKAQLFSTFIKEHFSIPVFEQDETLSTYEAESRMKNSPRYNFKVDLKQIDALAASIILEDFIRRNIRIHSL
jgi:putative Holliday junction resolvase